MKGKRKFIVTIIFEIIVPLLTALAIKWGVILSGNDFQSIIFWLMIGTSVLGGAMAIENISDAGGLRNVFSKKKEEKTE